MKRKGRGKMTLQEVKKALEQWVAEDSENSIARAYALRPELAGIPYYDAPLLGCAAADDPLFVRFQTETVICGPVFRLPEEWLPGARSVLSFFLPYSKPIRDSNRADWAAPSDAWLHGRIEGQGFLIKLCSRLAELLRDAGYQAVIPAGHPDFRTVFDPERLKRGEPAYASSWSERHVAYAAGLGTFGLSKHIITEKGVCGRFGSVITDAPLSPTPRPYAQPYEYCTFCGACGRHCPADAISVEQGKDILACADFVNGTMKTYAPRYGCGKCQLAVPCETGIPKKDGR